MYKRMDHTSNCGAVRSQEFNESAKRQAIVHGAVTIGMRCTYKSGVI